MPASTVTVVHHPLRKIDRSSEIREKRKRHPVAIYKVMSECSISILRDFPSGTSGPVRATLSR